jgi:hypothetical protein
MLPRQYFGTTPRCCDPVARYVPWMPSQVGQMLKLAGVDQLLKACATTFEFDCFRPVDPMFNVVALHDDAAKERFTLCSGAISPKTLE